VTIVALKNVTVLGHAEDKDQVIEDLQSFGCLHLIPLSDEGEPAGEGEGPSRQALEALKFLASCPYQRKQVSDPSRLDPIEVQTQALEVQKRLYALREDRDYLAERLKNLEPWGEFTFASLEEMDGLRFWFYEVPKHELGEFDLVEEPWEVVSSDHRFYYVIVIAADEPSDVPFDRTLTGARSPGELAEGLEEVELAIEDAEAARAALTRWCTLFARGLDALDDHAQRQAAAQQTYDEGPLFALQAWVPTERIEALRTYSSEHSLVLEVADPAPGDEPPTLFDNPRPLRAGEDLVTFYRTPAYALWDPSSVVFFSFAVFFAMIIADAGYGALIAGLTVWLWPRLSVTEAGRAWRVLLCTLSASTITYGVLVGSYFGAVPDPGSVPGLLRLIDLNDAGTMMALTIAIGGSHIIYANLRDAWRRRGSAAALAPLGWAMLVVGGLLLGAQLAAVPVPSWPGMVTMAAGVFLVSGFSGYGERPLGRALQGLLALTRLTKIFGDVLSYLRLFALGLASASLAVAFNDMATDVRSAFPGVGLLFALLILLLGHALNFVLAIASAVIHGLRLNLLEFFDWGVQDEGLPFRTFKRKESD
jgi:V/A-type H+-transporting ATPase subunit I